MELQEVEKRRLADLETEKRGFEETIRQFEGLKLE
jgi:valyl-tRNA synthetase